jgi:transcriptional antiterminator RfaH
MCRFVAGWHVLYTMPKHEKKVSIELGRNGYEYYMPVKIIARKWHDRNKYLETPLFQSYLFVKLNHVNDYYESLRIQGVLKYIQFGSELARISEQLIRDIQLTIQFSRDVELNSNEIPEGKRLLIKNGPLTGLECEVVRMNGRDRVLVRLQILKRNLLASFNANSLADISS